MHPCLRVGSGLIVRNTRPQAPDHAAANQKIIDGSQNATAAGGRNLHHGYRNHHVRTDGRIEAEEALREHADDAERSAVQTERLLQYRGVAAECLLPESV